MNKFLLILCLSIAIVSCKSEPESNDEALVPEKQETVKKEEDASKSFGLTAPFGNPRLNKESKTQQDKLDANNLEKLPEGSKIPENRPIKEYIPKISELISKAKIAKLVGVDATVITQKELNNKQNPGKIRSCFYKWKEPGNEDAGIFIQIQGNPVGDELPDWAKEYMKSKYQSGETMYPSDGNTYKYTKLDEIAEEAAFCHELKKVIWRPNTEVIVTVVDNYRVSDKNRIKNAKEISKVIDPQLGL